jgi:excisionase family DNA binding protein
MLPDARPTTSAPPPFGPLDDPDRPLNFREGCAFLGIGRRLGWSMCNDGTLPHLRVGKLIRFRRSALVAWTETQERKAARR